MKRTLLFVLICLLSVNSLAQTRRPARAQVPATVVTRSNTQTLPIRRVILYSNGVAYIERRGTVNGHAEVSLSFKQSQVDDVLKLIDDGARRDVNEFANASASARRRDAKTIVVTSDGAGPREMVVSYTIAAPIWKTTYRVVMDSQGKPFFQGWAIVDNVSEEDWNNISLSLVSGSPVSLIQPIQKPFYRYRPIVGMPSDLKLETQTYEANDCTAAGTISGTITDANGAVIPGASVTITNTATNQSFTTVSSNEGTYSSQVLSPGNYLVRVNAPGFKTYVIKDLMVGPNRAGYANLTLELGSTTETVTVTGGA